jgi:hypothetical protein
MAFCAAYLLFLLSPHFETLTHSHAHDGRAHHHDFLSAHDVALERALLTASIPGIAGVGPRGESAAALRPKVASGEAVPQGTAALRTAAANRHTHGQEDPNLLALGSQALPVHLVFAPLPRLETPAVLAAEAPVPRAGARAPPVRFI